MTDKKDDPNKSAGAGARPASATPDPKRPHAMIDLKATEVIFPKPDAAKGEAGAAAKTVVDAVKAATATTASTGKETKPGGTATASSTAVPPTKPADAKSAADARANTAASSAATAKPSVRADLPPAAAARAGGGMLSHLVAGVAGAAMTLFGWQMLGLAGPDGSVGSAGVPADVAKRIAALEQAAQQRPAAVTGDAGQKFAAAEGRLTKLEDAAQGLANGQMKVADELKSLEGKLSSTGPAGAGVADRLGKLEETLATLKDAAAADPRGAGRIPQLAQIASKLTELESALATRTATMRKEVTQDLDQRFAKSDELAEQARSRLASRTQSVEQTVKSVADETVALRTGFDGLKTDLEARFKAAAKPADLQAAVGPIASKMAAVEKDIQSVVRSEQERNATAGNILLSLELGNLKRALDRGGKYGSELAAVQKLAGGKLDLRVLESQQNTGVPTLATLGTELRGLAHGMLDADAEPVDASVTDRVLSGFKSIVRVRKTEFKDNEAGTEATIARMEKALKESRIADVIEEAGKLPPKAALPATDWIKRIEGRHAIDKALATLEASLKTALAGGAEPKKGSN